MIKAEIKENKGIYETKMTADETCLQEGLYLIDSIAYVFEKQNDITFRKMIRLIKETRKCAEKEQIKGEENGK